MSSFDVKYFDGLSSKAHEAKLSFDSNNWVVHVNDAQLFWPIDQIKQNEFKAEVNTFKFGDFPHQSIECRDPEIFEVLAKLYPQKDFFKKTYAFALDLSYAKLGLATLIVLAAFFGLYKYALPPIAEQLAMTVPKEYEILWGDQMLNNIIPPEPAQNLKELTLTKDQKLSLLANQFAQEIDFSTTYPIKISVVEDSLINAFALPGGNIIVFSGLLNRLKTKEEFVALLGHEVAHVNKRHSLKGLFRSLSGYLLISVLTSDLNGALGVILENTNEIKNLGYSRELEAEADAFAETVLERNKISKRGLLDLMTVLNGISTVHIPEILSSHPLTKDRLTFAQKALTKKTSVLENVKLTQIWAKIKE